MYTEKQSIIVVQANPKTHPGGVHGALFNSAYHSDPAPDPAKIPPKAKAPKFNNRKPIIFSHMSTILK